jgi:tRNA 2-selenouridine synthase
MNHISSYKVFFMPILHYNPSLIVLAGRTGSGKTAMLQYLAQQGYATIDLEQLAQHSGSAFGHLTFEQPVSPMRFLKNLEQRLDDCKYEPLVFTECKGKALGNAVLPESFLQKLQNGFIVHLDVPFDVRLERLTQAYAHVPPSHFISAAQKLEGKLPAEILTAIECFLNAHAYKKAIALLLDYYDSSPVYNRFIKQSQLTLTFEEIDAEEMVAELTEALMNKHPLFLNCC